MQDMHHITPCRFAKAEWAQPPTIPAALRAGRTRNRTSSLRIELRCRSWQLGKRGRPNSQDVCSLIIEVIILTTQRRANSCGDT